MEHIKYYILVNDDELNIYHINCHTHNILNYFYEAFFGGCSVQCEHYLLLKMMENGIFSLVATDALFNSCLSAIAVTLDIRFKFMNDIIFHSCQSFLPPRGPGHGFWIRFVQAHFAPFTTHHIPFALLYQFLCPICILNAECQSTRAICLHSNRLCLSHADLLCMRN